ncbi:hypothetical protein [Actinomadura alba]|uniref:CU044_5270 family protein n=1 Tax=Actinomadura alba TaxID=406431 RepID=A0ABR7LRE8_9ACTN|nr:hypothetical protein [Actinomadura alba]MBC6467420.1 hypothetical protein [Actinomadura alba]
MTDVEERLRAALHAKADTIEPSREAWEKAIASGRSGSRRLPFLAIPVLAAVTVAAVIAVSMVVAPEQPRRPAATPFATPGARLGQYYFVKERRLTENNGKEEEKKNAYRWVPVSPGATYYGVPRPDGKLMLMQRPAIVTDPEYDVRTWPSDPTQMLARASRLAAKAIASGRTNDEPVDDQALSILEGIAADPVTSPERVAAVFQAMTMVPGQRVSRNVKDPIGRPSIRLSKKNSLRGSYHTFFSPDARTYHGHEATYVDGPKNSWNVRSWRVIVDVKVVDRPGQFPEGEEAPAVITQPPRINRG